MITYRCADAQKPVSCELNELEVFSCVLGLEEETALSIVDPAAVHVSIDAQRVLHVNTAYYILVAAGALSFLPHPTCHVPGGNEYAEPAAVVPRHADVRGHVAVSAGAGQGCAVW